MTTLTRLQRLPGDERAQAMTEFVIVLPLILMMFFAAIETMVIARATQLGNYAAFAAARSYATSFSLFEQQTGSADSAHTQASDRAKNAALLLMAPVSQAQLGEGLPVWNQARGQAKNLGSMAWTIYGLAEGYAVAALFRVKNFEVQKPGNTSSSSESVRVSFDYEMPLVIPGFAEIWDYLARMKGTPLAEDTFTQGSFSADPGMLSTLNEILDGLELIDETFGLSRLSGIRDEIEDAIDQAYNGGFAGALYTVTINAKSVCGFEPWNGIPRTDDISSYCGAEPDPSREACRNATSTYQTAAELQAEVCEEARLAKDEYQRRRNAYFRARRVYLNCSQDPDADCDDEKDAMDEAEDRMDEAFDIAEDKKDECEDVGKDAEDAFDDMEDECD